MKLCIMEGLGDKYIGTEGNADSVGLPPERLLRDVPTEVTYMMLWSD